MSGSSLKFDVLISFKRIAKKNRDRESDDDLRQTDHQCIFKYIPEIRRMNQFFKIFQSTQSLAPDSFKDIIIFKSNHKAKHGQIPEQHKVQQTR